MMSIYDALSRLRGSLGAANQGANYGAPLGTGYRAPAAAPVQPWAPGKGMPVPGLAEEQAARAAAMTPEQKRFKLESELNFYKNSPMAGQDPNRQQMVANLEAQLRALPAQPASVNQGGFENVGRQFMQKRLDELLNSATIATPEAEAARAREIAQLRQALAAKKGDPLPAGTYTGPAIGAPPPHPFLQPLPQAPAYNASPSAPSTWTGGLPLGPAVQPSNPWGLPATGPGSWGYMTSAPSSTYPGLTASQVESAGMGQGVKRPRPAPSAENDINGNPLPSLLSTGEATVPRRPLPPRGGPESDASGNPIPNPTSWGGNQTSLSTNPAIRRRQIAQGIK